MSCILNKIVRIEILVEVVVVVVVYMIVSLRMAGCGWPRNIYSAIMATCFTATGISEGRTTYMGNKNISKASPFTRKHRNLVPM